jgi:hypothetical protein
MTYNQKLKWIAKREAKLTDLEALLRLLLRKRALLERLRSYTIGDVGVADANANDDEEARQ